MENIIENPPKNYNIDPRGLGRIYYDCMLRNKEKIAQICAVTGKTLTYGDILKRAIRVAITLKKRGVEPGDVVAICIYTHMHSTTIVAAGLFLGAIIVGIDEDLSSEDLLELLQEVTPKIAFVVDKTLELFISTKAMKNSNIVLLDSQNTEYTMFDKYLEPQVDEDLFQPYIIKSLQDTALIFFTSGTTGLPKGLTRSHLSLITSQHLLIGCNFCFDVIMDFSTPAWTIHLTFLTASIYTGSTRVIYQQFTPEHYWDFARHKVTILCLTVYEILSICNENKPNDADFSDLKTILLCGSILSLTKLNKIKKVFPNVKIHNYYGISEVGTISIFAPRNDHSCKTDCNHELSIGSGLPGVNIKIVDLDNEKPLGPNQNGELRVKMAHSYPNYLNYDSSNLVDEDGWFRTGDLAYYDENRYVYIVDRIKEVFKYQLYRIVPSILEDAILRHPGVDKAFVTGIHHDIDNERPIALITLKDFQNVTAKDVQDFVAEIVPDYLKLRGGVKIIEKFPMTHSGKIRRGLVRTWIYKNII